MLIHDFIPDLLNSDRRSERNKLDGASLSRMNSNTAGFGGPPTPVFTQPGRNGEFPFRMMLQISTLLLSEPMLSVKNIGFFAKLPWK